MKETEIIILTNRHQMIQGTLESFSCEEGRFSATVNLTKGCRDTKVGDDIGVVDMLREYEWPEDNTTVYPKGHK